MHYLWRAVDQECKLSESFVAKTRDERAALAFIKKALKRHGQVETVSIDGLRLHDAAIDEFGNRDKHEIGHTGKVAVAGWANPGLCCRLPLNGNALRLAWQNLRALWAHMLLQILECNVIPAPDHRRFFVVSAKCHRLPLLALLVPLLVAAAPAPPISMAPYFHGEQFDPGDYRWLRGAFEGASATEVEAYGAMIDWRRRCRISDMEETRADLAQIGIVAGPSLNTIPYRTLACSQAAVLPEGLDLGDWDGFARDVAAVRPFVQGFLAATASFERSSMVSDIELRDALIARSTSEQALRAGLIWATSVPQQEDAAENRFTSRQRSIIAAQLAIAMKTRDYANTAWLENIVASQGWPQRSQVGERAARAAWLLAQHADANPVFQVRALRLIEPLLAEGEVSRRSYAYLYDRLMLKIAGMQRYATQLTCRGGRWVPMPTEADNLVDFRRGEMGLEPSAENQARSIQSMGPCSEIRPAG